jgi:hypothetical protein
MLAEVRAADPEGGGLPRHVERELTEYLRCGVPSSRPIYLIPIIGLRISRRGSDHAVHAL